MLMMVVLVGCQNLATTTTQKNGQGNNGTGTNQGNAVAASDAASQACPDVLRCVDGCGQDQACTDKCVGGATPTAKQKYEAMVACMEQNGCTDAACGETNCASEVDACAADTSSSSSNGAKSGGNGNGNTSPTGAANLADLVGVWRSVQTPEPDTAYKLTINADGTYSLHFHYANPANATCSYFLTRDIVDDGKASIQNGLLVTTPTKSEQWMTQCSGTESGKTAFENFPRTYQFSLSGGQLTLSETDSDKTFVYVKD